MRLNSGYFLVFLSVIVLFSSGFLSEASAVNFVDSSGYTPSWAQNMGIYFALDSCGEFAGTNTADGDWCMEWMAYVLDQGIENFPQSASGNVKPIPNFALEDGPLYSGDLSKFLPEVFIYGDDWQVGKPFTLDFDQLKSLGVTDFVSQRIVVPDEWDDDNFLKLSFIIMEFEDTNLSSEFYSKIKDTIYSQNYPTSAEFWESYEKTGILGDKIELEKESKYFVADCIGQVINFSKENEGSKLTCVKENYIITIMATWKTDLYNKSFTMGGTEDAVYGYSKIIINNIDNILHSDSNVKFPNNSQYVAYQYSMEKISDNELLSYFQKSIDEGKIQFPTDSIVIKENSQRLSYIPDFTRISIIHWGEGTLTDAQFANTMVKLVESGYLTIPGFDSSSITVSIEEKTPFLDMDSEDDTKITLKTTQESSQVEKSDDDSENGGGCLIATATYGSELAPQVQQLRELRDTKLLQTESGSAFMESFNDFYYSFSPGIADYERENPVLREAVKLAITPMISSLSILNYVDMETDAEVLGYGISLILLNVGMYFGVPAIVLVVVRKRV